MLKSIWIDDPLRAIQSNYMSKGLQELNNPETNDRLISHAIYSNQKQARLQAQNQRQQVQYKVAYLERQAKKEMRLAEQRKKSLENYYSIVQSRVQDFREKEKLFVRQAKKLQQMKQANFSLKMTSAANRASARSRLQSFNKQVASEVKTFRSLSERKIIEERELERSLLRKKNEAITNSIIEANANSRVRAIGERKAASNEVKGQLIRVQESLKQKEVSKISQLNSRQKELLQIAQKRRRERQKYEITLFQTKTLPIDEVYTKIKKKMGSRRSHRHSFV